MGKPVICPHCNQFFVSTNEPGNPFCMCPHCGRWMNVFPPVRRKKRRPAGPAKCPLCGAQLPPGADTCLKCKRQIVTGEKLPLLRRWALVPTNKKMIVLCGTLAGLIVLIVLVNLLVSWLPQAAAPPPTRGPGVDSPELVAARKLLAEILASTDEVDQIRLGGDLGKLGGAALGMILETLEKKDLSDGARTALIIALGEIGDPGGADAAALAMGRPRFRQTAMVSLALMGDPRAVAPMTARFVEQVRLAALGEALIRESLVPAGVSAALSRRGAERVSRLREPVAALGEQALPTLLTTYWEAWRWPGRKRGRVWLDELDRLVAQMRLEKGVTETLEGLLTGQSPEVRLAAAVLLDKQRDGSRADAERRAGLLADLLADRRLETRQRAVWTISALTKEDFARYSADEPPCRVTGSAVVEAAKWAERQTGRRTRVDEALLKQHKSAPSATRRCYHPARAAARRSIDGLAQADWPAARARYSDLAQLPPDAAPVVRTLLAGDVKQLKVPARLVVLMLLAQWRDRASVRLLERLDGLFDNPSWMPACLAIARSAAARDARPDRWLDRLAGLDPSLLTGGDSSTGLVPADLGRLIASLGLPALAALHKDPRFHRADSPLTKVYDATVDAMIGYGWPASVWLKEFGGR